MRVRLYIWLWVLVRLLRTLCNHFKQANAINTKILLKATKSRYWQQKYIRIKRTNVYIEVFVVTYLCMYVFLDVLVLMGKRFVYASGRYRADLDFMRLNQHRQSRDQWKTQKRSFGNCWAMPIFFYYYSYASLLSFLFAVC